MGHASHLGKHPSEVGLRSAVAVKRGGVKVVDACAECGGDCVALFLGVALCEKPTDRTASKSQHGYREASHAKSTEVH